MALLSCLVETPSSGDPTISVPSAPNPAHSRWRATGGPSELGFGLKLGQCRALTREPLGCAKASVPLRVVDRQGVPRNVRVQVTLLSEAQQREIWLAARRMAESVVNRVLTTRDVVLNWLRQSR